MYQVQLETGIVFNGYMNLYAEPSRYVIKEHFLEDIFHVEYIYLAEVEDASNIPCLYKIHAIVFQTWYAR